jgi:hypothetical protein
LSFLFGHYIKVKFARGRIFLYLSSSGSDLSASNFKIN